MTILELIQQQVSDLSPEKQSEVLDFAAFLRRQPAAAPPARRRSPAVTPHLVCGGNVTSTRWPTSKTCAPRVGHAYMNALFDTNIVIDALNGVVEADTEYERYERVLISRITWLEVLVGAAEDEMFVRNFLETRFEVCPLDSAVAERAVELRLSRLRLPDAIIWATAQVYGFLLVTRNTKDFDPAWEGIRMPYQVKPVV